ncbi:MAG TPA: xanthine dehydrogenase family protein subunit M [Kofleriaceae bacterium]|jgi:carbon-monoxide dehydrogenase medium subunit|nr:xanthine dehydrogenase family protein subunit M [Kofleriaceae bacterium]
MIPASFDYHAPTTLDEAIALLGRLGDTAKILAGGQSLIPAMRFRLASPEVLVDINRIRDLAYVEERGDHLAIGAMTREHALEASPVVAKAYPLLFDTAKVIADPLVRNKATVGGNLAHADPANDHPATMLALGAQVIAHGAGGTRTIAIDDLFVGLFETSLRPGEILTEIRIPKPAAGSGGAYLKIERKVGDYAVAAVAVQLELAGAADPASTHIRTIRIGLTNVSPIPMRAKAAEVELTGKPPTEEVLEAAGQAAGNACDPSADLRGQIDYKRDLVRVLTKRAVRRAIERARGGRP